MEWLLALADAVGLTWTRALWGGLIFLATFVVSLLAVGFLLVRLPATYFQQSHNRDLWVDRHPVLRWTGLVLKNLLGVVLVVVGVLLSLPGVPGQGLLTILIGVMLLNFPGKRRLERWLISRRGVLNAINRLRARFNRPPLVLDDEPAAEPKLAGPSSHRLAAPVQKLTQVGEAG
jgi:hypothetical protein